MIQTSVRQGPHLNWPHTWSSKHTSRLAAPYTVKVIYVGAGLTVAADFRLPENQWKASNIKKFKYPKCVWYKLHLLSVSLQHHTVKPLQP